jgi:hypothetical protein
MQVHVVTGLLNISPFEQCLSKEHCLKFATSQ